jgi:hypothetical protein
VYFRSSPAVEPNTAWGVKIIAEAPVPASLVGALLRTAESLLGDDWGNMNERQSFCRRLLATYHNDLASAGRFRFCNASYHSGFEVHAWSCVLTVFRTVPEAGHRKP